MLMAFLYIAFIYINFAQGTYGDGMQIFGCNMYIIDSNQTVFVDYSKLPKQGDMVLYEVDGEKKIASVNSISQSNILFLSVDDNGEIKYYNEPMVYGVITSIIPGLSYIYLFLTSFWGIFLIIILPCGFILTFQFITLIKMFSKNKLKTKNGFNFETSVPLRQRRKTTDDIQKPTNTKTSTSNTQRGRRNVKLDSYNQFSGVAKQKKGTFSNNDNLNNFSQNRPSFNNTPSNDFSPNKHSFNSITSNDTSSNDDFYDFSTALKYKICFKEFRKMSKRLIETIEDGNERLYALNEYGLATTNIEDGVEIKIHPPAVSEITLKLKNDGSLIIDTNTYTANIDMEIE